MSENILDRVDLSSVDGGPVVRQTNNPSIDLPGPVDLHGLVDAAAMPLAKITEFYDEWLMSDECAVTVYNGAEDQLPSSLQESYKGAGDETAAQDYNQEFSCSFAGSTIYSPAAMHMAYVAGWCAFQAHQIDAVPIYAFNALLDKYERLSLLLEARRIKVEEHPTRDRLLAAVQWALIDQPGMAPHDKTETRREYMARFRAELRRVAGL